MSAYLIQSFNDLPDILECDGWLLELLPPEGRTYEMCEAASRSATKRLKDARSILCWIPEEFKTPKILLNAIQANGEALRDIPEKLRTYNLCIEAVRQNGFVLSLVPHHLLYGTDICMTAVSEDGLALQFVPENLRTEQLCQAAMTQTGKAFPYVPERYRIPSLCLRGLDFDSETLQLIPADIHELVLHGLPENLPPL